MKITFIGSGYVGLVSGTLLSFLGADVTCCDNNEEKIQALQDGKLPIYEPGLEGYIKEAVIAGRLRFKTGMTGDADVVFIAVGTPPLELSGEADLSYVYDATLQAAQSYSPDTLIVIKSTVPPGTCLALQSMLHKNGFEHSVASNPEFLREGSAIEDFLNPDRIVIGFSNEEAANILSKVYKSLVDKGFAMLRTDPTTSELIKYASNSFLATKIGFINEMANLCEKVGADIDSLSTGMGLDSRIGSAFLKAGPGFGGSCFPKDLLALSHIARTYDQPCHILDAVIFSNQNRCAHMVSKISEAIGDLRGKTICILGITFKAETDDVRSSPAVDIVQLLLSKGAKVSVYDPEGAENGAREIPAAEFSEGAYASAESSEAIVILTEWDEFKRLDFKRMHGILAKPNIFDFRNILDRDALESLGFNYYRIGG